jgi:hypothetical protein
MFNTKYDFFISLKDLRILNTPSNSLSPNT